MVQFITRNPVTGQIDANQARDMQNEMAASQALSAYEQRQQVRAQDELGRGIASIYAEPDVPAQVTATQPAQPEQAVVSPVKNMAPRFAAPAPQPEYKEGVSPVKNMAPRYDLQPTQPEKPVAQSPLTSISAQPKLSREQRALNLAANTKYGGAAAMRLAEGIQNRNDAAHAAAIKAFGEGDFGMAQALNTKHGLGMDAVFNNPGALQVSKALASSISHLKMDAPQAIAYMDAAGQKFSEVMQSTRDMKQAMNQAGMAGMSAARAFKPKGDKVLKTPWGYFDQSIDDYVTDKTGKKVMPPDRELYFPPQRGGAGGGGATPKAIATMQWKAEQYRNLGMSPEISGAVAANPSMATTPEAIRRQAEFIVKSNQAMGNDISVEQAIRQSKNLMREVQNASISAMGGDKQTAPPTPPPARTLNAGGGLSPRPEGSGERVRTYIPGQGFTN